MVRRLTVYYTSDTHAYLSPVDYASGNQNNSGLSNCISNFRKDGNTLVIDGGDAVQGSPLSYYLHKNGDLEAETVAEIMNIGGYDFITLGNHDFNYGLNVIKRYLKHLKAQCLCANIEGMPEIGKTAMVRLENGLNVGLTGIVTPFVNVWEKTENLAGITIGEPVEAASYALELLRSRGADITVCIYHGGFEADIESGKIISETGENSGWRICNELGFDILLTGHQHLPIPGRMIAGTFTCQPPDRAKSFIRMEIEETGNGSISVSSSLVPAGDKANEKAAKFLEPYEKKTAVFLDTPVGHLDTPLRPESHIRMAAQGTLIANFFNQVQLYASGADISETCLGNQVKGFEKEVTVRDVVSTYIFPNTLTTLSVNRDILRRALERSAEYFSVDERGMLSISESFLKPHLEHYNFDYFFGIEAVIDVSLPVGRRVISIKYKGTELDDETRLSLCMNNYRASGTGGYPFFRECPIIREQADEVSGLIIEYLENSGAVSVDKTAWLTVTGYKTIDNSPEV